MCNLRKKLILPKKTKLFSKINANPKEKSAEGEVKSFVSGLIPNQQSLKKVLNVKSTTIDILKKEYKLKKIDIIKLDIEGGEMEVLRDCKDYLHNVERIFVEHHSFLESPQQLSDFFGVLENAGFRINVQVDIPAKQPFLKRYIYNKKYSWINVFGFRN